VAGLDARQLIEGTISDLDEAIDRLQQEREGIETKIADIQQRREAWRVELRKLGNGFSASKKPRLRKGEAKRRIVELFEGLADGAGLSISDVAKGLNISWSSVRNVFKKEGTDFVERDGVWFLNHRKE